MSESLGKTLRKIRESKQISLEEVSERTRIPKKIISTIEEDRLKEIPSEFYARTFVKLYAQFLSTLEEKAIKEYLSAGQKKETLLPVVKDEKAREDWFIKHKKHIGTAVLVILGICVLIFGFAQMKRFVKNVSVKHRAHAAERQKQKKQKHKEVQRKNKEAAVKQPLLEPVQKKEREFELRIEARYNTWVQVESDGTLLFRGTLKKGTRDIWKAKKEIILEVGNAGGVILSVDGKDLGSPGKKGEKKMVRVTKDGIKP